MLRIVQISLLAFSVVLVINCSDVPKCIDDKELVAYLSVPEIQPGENISNNASLLKKMYGGKVIAISLIETDPAKKYIRLENAQADEHMLATTGFKLDSGGPHDALALTAAQKMPPPWVYLSPDTKPGINGCGIFATAVCNRKLGLETSQFISQTEWDKTYQELGSFNGITPFSYIANYYQRKGFCTETRALRGYCSEYDTISYLQRKGCDIKLFFARKSSAWFSPYSNPHIETVTEIPSICSAVTNSWGYPARVTGGYCTEFSHERSTTFTPDEDFAWAPHDARVWVQITCDCDTLEKQLSYINELVSQTVPTWQQPCSGPC